jgi:hypothetical protein
MIYAMNAYLKKYQIVISKLHNSRKWLKIIAPIVIRHVDVRYVWQGFNLFKNRRNKGVEIFRLLNMR